MENVRNKLSETENEIFILRTEESHQTQHSLNRAKSLLNLRTPTEMTIDTVRQLSETVFKEAYPNQIPLSLQGGNLEKILQSEPKATEYNTPSVTKFNPSEVLPRYEHATVIRKYHPKIVKRSGQDDETTQPPATIVSPSKGKLQEHYQQFHKSSSQDSGRIEDNNDAKVENNTDASYKFGFVLDQQTRNEKSDANGNVEGSYSYIGDDGFLRRVEYEAGAKLGFRINKVTIQKVKNSTNTEGDKKGISNLSIGDSNKDKNVKEKNQSKNHGDIKLSTEEFYQEDEPDFEEKKDNLYSLYYKIPQPPEFKTDDRSSLYSFDNVESSNPRLLLNGENNPSTQIYDGQLSETYNPHVSVNDGSYSLKQKFTSTISKEPSNTYTGVPLFTPITRSINNNSGSRNQYEAKEIAPQFFKPATSFEDNPRNPTFKLTDQFGQKDTIEESIKQDSPEPHDNYRVVIKKDTENNPKYGINPYFWGVSKLTEDDLKDVVGSDNPEKDTKSIEPDTYTEEYNEKDDSNLAHSTDLSTPEAILEPTCIRRLVATTNKRCKKVHRKRKKKNSKIPLHKLQENYIKINPDRSYSFAYNVKDHSRQEVVDSKGNVHSSYQIKGNDGSRTVVVFDRRTQNGPRTSFLLVQNPTNNKYSSYFKPNFPRYPPFQRRQVNNQPSSILSETDTILERSDNSPHYSTGEPLNDDSTVSDNVDQPYRNSPDSRNMQYSQNTYNDNYNDRRTDLAQEQSERPFRGNIKFKMPETLAGEDHYY